MKKTILLTLASLILIFNKTYANDSTLKTIAAEIEKIPSLIQQEANQQVIDSTVNITAEAIGFVLRKSGLKENPIKIKRNIQQAFKNDLFKNLRNKKTKEIFKSGGKNILVSWVINKAIEESSKYVLKKTNSLGAKEATWLLLKQAQIYATSGGNLVKVAYDQSFLLAEIADKNVKAYKELQSSKKSLDKSYSIAERVEIESHIAIYSLEYAKLSLENEEEAKKKLYQGMLLVQDLINNSKYNDPIKLRNRYIHGNEDIDGFYEKATALKIRHETENTCYTCNNTLTNINSAINQGNNSHIGSPSFYMGWNSTAETTNKSTNQLNTFNSSPLSGHEQAALSTNTIEYSSSDWQITSGQNTTHFSSGKNFGSITAPNGGIIHALNNAGVHQTVMQKTVTIPTGVKQVTVDMLANFVTNEYPNFVGSEFNDNASITITTGSGNTYSATIFNKELNSANFTTVNNLPNPLLNSGGQTGFESTQRTIPVANGGTLTIKATTTNVGDTAYPSATLINGVTVK